MPMPPADPGQHSLRALSDLVGRLSSGVNSRTLQQQAGGGPAQELFRIQQFTEGEGGDPFLGGVPMTLPRLLGSALMAALMPASDAEPYAVVPGASGLAEDAPGIEGPGWRSIEDALKLTPHEVELLRVIESVQSHLAEQLGGVWQASSRALLPQREAKNTAPQDDGEEHQEAGVDSAARKDLLRNDDSAGSAPVKRSKTRRGHQGSSKNSEAPGVLGPAAAIKLEPSGRGPTPHEARTAFLQLFGSRQVCDEGSRAYRDTFPALDVAMLTISPLVRPHVRPSGVPGQVDGRKGEDARVNSRGDHCRDARGPVPGAARRRRN